MLCLRVESIKEKLALAPDHVFVESVYKCKNYKDLNMLENSVLIFAGKVDSVE